MHLPGGRADDGAGGEEVGVESCAGFGDDAGEAADDAEGEAEGFFYYGGLEEGDGGKFGCFWEVEGESSIGERVE